MSGGVDGWGTCVWWRPAGSVARGGSVFRAVYVYVYVCVRVCMCVFVCLIPRHVAHIHDEYGVGRVGVAVGGFGGGAGIDSLKKRESEKEKAKGGAGGKRREMEAGRTAESYGYKPAKRKK
jgi:hypothetical protein